MDEKIRELGPSPIRRAKRAGLHGEVAA
jgi:hypothetical protein